MKLGASKREKLEQLLRIQSEVLRLARQAGDFGKAQQTRCSIDVSLEMWLKEVGVDPDLHANVMAWDCRGSLADWIGFANGDVPCG